MSRRANLTAARAPGLTLLLTCGACRPVATDAPPPAALPTLEQALAARHDPWGEAARARPEGPSYAFFEPLLPPLRYVHARFRQHPVVLSAPGCAHKTRVGSDGAGIELPADAPMWTDGRVPLAFSVGAEREPFGADPERLDGPRWCDGWLPVLENRYRQGTAVYEETVFAAVGPTQPAGAVLVRFALVEGEAGEVAARLGTAAGEPPALVRWDASWHRGAEGVVVAELRPDRPATLAYDPAPGAGAQLPGGAFEAALARCAAAWEERLSGGLSLAVPEPRVNDAARAQLAGILLLARGDELLYSARNGYEQTFEAECGDAALALALWGHGLDGRYVRSLLERPLQAGIPNSDRAFQLQLLARFHWLARDPAFVEGSRALWSAAAEGLLASRREDGLLERENYCGDVVRQVRSLYTHASAWRGLRDLAAVLAELGDQGAAERYARAAADLRAATLAAVDASVDRAVDPPFVPNALREGVRAPYPLTASYEGSYWNLLAPFTLDSGLFPAGDERAEWIVRAMREEGGLCMGLVRFDQHSGVYANERALDDLYTLRYALFCLDRDEPDHALTAFYAKLAQGMTRGTLVSAEGTGLVPEDRFGRPMYLPPVVSGNALFLQLLRHLLVHELDDDGDGVPDGLMLAMATPRPWLEDGGRIALAHAPTAFGEVGLTIEAHLARGEVLARVTPPPRPAALRLRLRLPSGWRVTSAERGGLPVAADARGTFDLGAPREPFVLRCKVRRNPAPWGR